MSKFLRTCLILSLVAPFLVMIPSSTARAEPPINPGTWTGFFTRQIEITNSVGGVLIEAFGAARADLNLVVDGNGGVTGKIEYYFAEISWKVSPPLTPGGKCSFSGAWDVTGGTVTISPAYLPVFDLQLNLVAHSVQCNPPPTGNSTPAQNNSVHFEAKTYSGGKITGEEFRFKDDMIDMVISSMAQAGAQMSVQEYWELNGSSATIQAPTPDYIEYFLQGVQFMNTYKTSVDWHDSPPGVVNFNLGNWTQEGIYDEPFYIADLELGKLPAGKNPLTVTAIGADGLPKGSQSMDVIIVPQEEWAQKAGFSVAQTVPSDIFKVVIYRGKTFVPKEPITLPYLDLSSIPVIGGKWGMEKPFQVVVNLEATSKGGLSNPAPVTGEASLFLGDVKHPLKLTVDGQTVTNMTENALLFDHGNMNFNSTPLSFTRSVGMIDLVPAAQALYKIPVVGKIIEWFNALGLGIDLELTTQAKGQGDLGVSADKKDVIFTKGSITPSVSISAKAGVFPDPVKVAVGGGGKGTFQIRIAPTTGLENCWVSIKFTVWAFSTPYDSPDYGVAQCQQAMLTSQRVQAAYLPSNDVIRIQTASSLAMNLIFAGQNIPAAQTSPATILASGLSPDASLDLASAVDGRLAFVYSPGQAGQLGLRVFDGQDWGEAILLGDAGRVNLNPVVAFDASGQIIAAWVAPVAGPLPPMDAYAPYFRSWEVSYAALDKSGKVISQGSLTTDDIPDYDLHLEGSPDGSLWLAWIKSPSVDLWGSLEDPNWLQAASWEGNGWSDVETVSQDLVGAVGFSLAAGKGKDASIATSQDTDGNPQTINDLEINLYQHSGSSWKAVQELTSDQETDVFPHAAYTPDGELVVAWKRGDALVGLEGDLKAAPSTWNIEESGQVPDLLGGELIAGANGQVAFVWSGFTPNGQGAWLVQRPSAGAGWQPASPLLDGLEGAGMVRAVFAADGDLWVGISQLQVPVESQDVTGLGQVSLPGQPTGSDLAVFEAGKVIQPASSGADTQDGAGVLNEARAKLSPLLLAGLGAIVGVVLLVGIVVVVRKRG